MCASSARSHDGPPPPLSTPLPLSTYLGWLGWQGGSIPFMGMLGEMFPEAQFLITGGVFVCVCLCLCECVCVSCMHAIGHFVS